MISVHTYVSILKLPLLAMYVRTCVRIIYHNCVHIHLVLYTLQHIIYVILLHTYVQCVLHILSTTTYVCIGGATYTYICKVDICEYCMYTRTVCMGQFPHNSMYNMHVENRFICACNIYMYVCAVYVGYLML